MDLNLVVLCGRLAAPVEVRQYDSGTRMVTALITVRSEKPKRVDVIPVTQWDPDPESYETLMAAHPGVRLWVAGSTQRRFHDQGDGTRRSRCEIVADQICVRPEEGQVS